MKLEVVEIALVGMRASRWGHGYATETTQEFLKKQRDQDGWYRVGPMARTKT